MKTPVATFLFGVAWLSLAGGCGKGESNGAGDRDAFITEYCAEFADCCEAAGRPADGSQCRSLIGAFSSSGGYDKGKGQACLEEIRAAPDKCSGAPMGTSSCEEVFVGSAGSSPPGGPCDTSSDCAPSAQGEVECVTHFSGDTSTSQCEEKLHGVEGSAPCVGTVDGDTTYGGGPEGFPATGYLCHVAENLACDSESGACQKLPVAGEPCGSNFYPCTSSAFCESSSGSRACQTRLALGSECTSDQCVAGAYCPSGGGTCTAQLAAGAACTTGVECSTKNCANGKCSTSSLGSDFALALLCGSN